MTIQLDFLGSPPWTNKVESARTFIILLHGFRQLVVSDDPYRSILRHTALAAPCASAGILLIAPQAPRSNWSDGLVDPLRKLHDDVCDLLKVDKGIFAGLSDGATQAIRLAWATRSDLVCHSGVMTRDLQPKRIAALGTPPSRCIFAWTLDDPFPTDSHTRRLAELHRKLGCDVLEIEQDSKNPNRKLIGRHHWDPAINGRVVEWASGQMSL